MHTRQEPLGIGENEFHEGALDIGAHGSGFDPADSYSPGQVGSNDTQDRPLGIMFDLCAPELLLDLGDHIVRPLLKFLAESDDDLLVARDGFIENDGDGLFVLLDLVREGLVGCSDFDLVNLVKGKGGELDTPLSFSQEGLVGGAEDDLTWLLEVLDGSLGELDMIDILAGSVIFHQGELGVHTDGNDEFEGGRDGGTIGRVEVGGLVDWDDGSSSGKYRDSTHVSMHDDHSVSVVD
jgi:hypothetical protein